MADDNGACAVYLNERRLRYVSVDKDALISSSHSRDQKELKEGERARLGNSNGGEVGRGGLPRQLVTQRQAHHRKTLMLHQSYYSIASLPHHRKPRAFLVSKHQMAD